MLAKMSCQAVVLTLLGCVAGARSSQMQQALQKRGMYLADLWSNEYRVMFPQPEHNGVAYQNRGYGYLDPSVSPNGLSLFAVRRFFDGQMPPKDLVVRRSLQGGIGPEEI